MIRLGVLLILVLAIGLISLLFAILSPKLRGFVIGLLLMVMFGGFALVLLVTFASYKRANATRDAAQIEQQRAYSQQYELRPRRVSRAMHPRETILPSDAVVADHPSEGVVQFVHQHQTAAEVNAASDLDVLGADVRLASHDATKPIGADRTDEVSDASTASEATVETDGALQTEPEVVDVAGSTDAEIADGSEDAESLAVSAEPPSEAAIEDDTIVEQVVEEEVVEEEVVGEPQAVVHVESAGAAEALSPPVQKPDPEPGQSVKRPAWVEAPPPAVGGRPAIVVVSDAFETAAECEQNLKAQIQSQVLRYAIQKRRHAGGPITFFPLSDHDIRELTRDHHVEVVSTSVGPMKQIHQLVVFDEEFDRGIHARFHRAAVGQRLAQAGVMSGGVLLLLTTVFGLLKISTRPRRARSS